MAKQKSSKFEREAINDFGAAAPRIIERFDRALAGRDQLKTWISQLSSKPNPTVRDYMWQALYRHQLSFREPPLPEGAALNGVTLWEYWVNHLPEYLKYNSDERKILAYLQLTDEVEKRRKEGMMNLIRASDDKFMALYPVFDHMLQAQAGRPLTRPLVAVAALQLRIDGSTWTDIANRLCDCPKAAHDEFCKANISQSVRKLRALLNACGVEPSVCT